MRVSISGGATLPLLVVVVLVFIDPADRATAAPPPALSGKPVLTYAHGFYGLLFRLRSPLPRDPDSRRILAGATVEGSQTLLRNGRPCYEEEVDSSNLALRHPRLGRLYRIRLFIRDGSVPQDQVALSFRVRLQRATEGYSPRDAQTFRDPLGRSLHCVKHYPNRRDAQPT